MWQIMGANRGFVRLRITRKESIGWELAEIEETRRLLWRSVAEEAVAGPIAQNLQSYLRERSETRVLQFLESERSRAESEMLERSRLRKEWLQKQSVNAK